jgi:hypothetical protein
MQGHQGMQTHGGFVVSGSVVGGSVVGGSVVGGSIEAKKKKIKF